MNRWAIRIACLTAPWLAACEGLGPQHCTLDVRPAIVVTIVDAVTDQPLADGAAGFIRDGSYEDTLEPYEIGTEMLSRSAGAERPGIYSVVVNHAGYATWQVDGVAVNDGRCHVQTVSLRAGLVAN